MNTEAPMGGPTVSSALSSCGLSRTSYVARLATTVACWGDAAVALHVNEHTEPCAPRFQYSTCLDFAPACCSTMHARSTAQHSTALHCCNTPSHTSFTNTSTSGAHTSTSYGRVGCCGGLPGGRLDGTANAGGGDAGLEPLPRVVGGVPGCPGITEGGRGSTLSLDASDGVALVLSMENTLGRPSLAPPRESLPLLPERWLGSGHCSVGAPREGRPLPPSPGARRQGDGRKPGWRPGVTVRDCGMGTGGGTSVRPGVRGARTALSAAMPGDHGRFSLIDCMPRPPRRNGVRGRMEPPRPVVDVNAEPPPRLEPDFRGRRYTLLWLRSRRWLASSRRDVMMGST